MDSAGGEEEKEAWDDLSFVDLDKEVGIEDAGYGGSKGPGFTGLEAVMAHAKISSPLPKGKHSAHRNHLGGTLLIQNDDNQLTVLLPQPSGLNPNNDNCYVWQWPPGDHALPSSPDVSLPRNPV